MLELYFLLAYIIIAAVIAVESHNLLSSVISVGAVGLGLCIIFLMLGAPELAMTQLVVEILALIVLIRATISVSVPETYKARELHSYGMAIVFIAVFMAVSTAALAMLKGFGSPIMTYSNFYIEKGLSLTGASNIVSAIVLNFRSFDSLGAAAVIFTAVIGTLALLRSKGRIK